MGKAARTKQQRRQGVQLEEGEARRLLTAQRNEVQAQLAARDAADLVNARVKAAGRAKNQIFDALVQKYHLDPNRAYALDDDTLMLTPVP